MIKKKKVVFGGLLIFFILAICAIYIWQTKNMNNSLQVGELSRYCIKNSTCNAKDFYIEKLDNYYFAVSIDGSDEKSDELMIFRQNEKGRNDVEVFGGYSPSNTKQPTTYSWYESTFPSFNGKSTGSSMVIFSSNKEKICKGTITMKENQAIREKTYDVKSNMPFVIKIDKLGKIDNTIRDVVEVHFYNESGNEVTQYKEK